MNSLNPNILIHRDYTGWAKNWQAEFETQKVCISSTKKKKIFPARYVWRSSDYDELRVNALNPLKKPFLTQRLSQKHLYKQKKER